MKDFWHSSIFMLLVDIAVICFCSAGIYLVHLKANLPVGTTTVDSFLVVDKLSSEAHGFSKGQKISAIDGYTFDNWEEMELYLDGKRIGEKINIKVDNNTKPFETILTSYYSLLEILIISIVGLFFIFFAILVRIKAPKNRSAVLFHRASLGLGMVITMTAGNYTFGHLGYGHVNRILWIAAYSITPVLFIHFAFSFVKGRDKRKSRILSILYSVAVIHVFLLGYFFFDASINTSLSGIENYVWYYDTVFRVFQTACIIAAISICIYAYKNASKLEERKRLQWLLLGFFIGPFSFVILWILPILLTGNSLLPESLAILFLIAIPVTFSIAIVKYKLMDIHLLVRRSIVYSIILATIILIYIGLSSIITLFVSDVNPAFPSVLTAIAVVLALQPVKNNVQKFVDKRFFRVEYDFREEQKKFLDDIKKSLDIRSLANKIVTQTNLLIPVDNIGFFLLSKPDYKIKMIANIGWDKLKGRSLRFEKEKLKTDLSIPVALVDGVEPGVEIEAADVKVFKKWGMVLVFPVKSPSGTIHAFIALGEKLAGVRYLEEDIDLLNIVSTATALAIDRIKLQEDLVREKLEAERLEKLNEIKSQFVADVSHDFKSPLSSIKNFTELILYNQNIERSKLEKYLNIIDGENERLNRMIDNVLDFSVIEKGKRKYAFDYLLLDAVIVDVIEVLSYLFKMNNVNVKTELRCNGKLIFADEDAFREAFMNLISNSVKYSGDKKCISIKTGCVGDKIFTSVSDNGIGIGKEHIDKIFDSFYRPDNSAKGIGIGLAIVKHIMDAHNGNIEVDSEIGKGSTFTLWFPEIKNEKNINN